jgi:hypothetical protein
VRRPAVCDALAGPIEEVLEPEARASDVAAAGLQAQTVVETRRDAEADVGLRHERLDALRAQGGIPAGVALEVLDAGDLEPDEVGRVVRDALCVRLGKPDAHLRREREFGHGGTLAGSRGRTKSVTEVVPDKRFVGSIEVLGEDDRHSFTHLSTTDASTGR